MNITHNGKNALVGAATSGIGAGIAIELAKCGANVTIMARDEEKLKNAAANLPIVHKEQHHQYLVVDFLNFTAFKEIIHQYFEKHSIDILVNNTNGPEAGVALDKTTEDYQNAFDLLFKTVCETTALALFHMEKQHYGRIVNVSSLSVKEPIANLALSNVIRSAVIAWSKTLSIEVAKYNITINNILTGYFDTERIREMNEDLARSSNRPAEEIRKEREEKIPMKRYGNPEEYGYLVSYLASDYAAYITGASIPLDGGLNNTY